MLRVANPLGTEFEDLVLPGHAFVAHMKNPEVLSDPKNAIADSLLHPIGSKSLKEIALDKKGSKEHPTATIVVSDNTRPVPYKGDSGILLPVIETLLDAGYHVEDILVLVATGMHREMREDEYGPKSLHNEIYEIAKTFSMASNCKVTIEYGNWPQSFNPDYDIFFIHLVQESLTNSIKHGNAENVSIICWKTSDLISISVSNDGLKAENGEVKFGLGLSGIYEFVTKWNGRMEFPPVQEGFSLLVELPVV